MRIICDACAKAPAILFCAADEAALCGPCDAMVHMCNKLARRHVRVRLVEPNAVACCDICENLPAFFFCKVDGTSLCLQCDVIVHVGVKRSHERYLLLRQRVEHAEPITEREQNGLLYQRQILGKFKEKMDDFPPVDMTQVHDSAVIDLNAGPQGMQGHISNSS